MTFPNPLQRLTIAGGAVALIALAIFPPWHYNLKSGIREFAGFHFVLNPGKAAERMSPLAIDSMTLFACCAVILVITGVFLLLFHGLSWNPFLTAKRVMVHKATRYVLAGCLLIALVYVGMREYRIAGEVAAYKKGMKEWAAKVKAREQLTLAERFMPLGENLFPDEPLLVKLRLQESPYKLTPEEKRLYDIASSKGYQVSLDSLPEDPLAENAPPVKFDWNAALQPPHN